MADRERKGLPQTFWAGMPASVLHPNTFPDRLRLQPSTPDRNSPSYPRMPSLSDVGSRNPVQPSADDWSALLAPPDLSTLGSSLNPHGYIPEPGDDYRLARIMFAEASNTQRDYPAIGWSVVNRVGMPDKAPSLEGVIHQRGQYESVAEGGGGPEGNNPWRKSATPDDLTGPDRKSWANALATAKGILDGSIADPTNGATMFLPSTVYDGNPMNGPRDFRRMFKENRIAPSPYNSHDDWPGTNYLFIEKPAGKARR